MSGDFRKGDRVTGELKTWYDGSPVLSWPNPNYLGTVKKVEQYHGCTYARVRFDSGRTESVNVDRLFLVDGAK